MTGPPPRPTALVTGASRGLGAVISEYLAGRGFDLVVVARSEPELFEEARRLERLGGSVSAVTGDVSAPTVRRAVHEALERRTRLDVLVNNASELGPSPLPPLAAVSREALSKVLEVNVLAPVALVQENLGLLRSARGLVVNISSDAAIGGYPGWGAYGASKAALDLLSLTMAKELKESGVSVVSVDPGDMRTRMQQAAFPGEDISDRPLPEVTLPFWAWLFGQPGELVSGRRYRAQSERWETAA